MKFFALACVALAACTSFVAAIDSATVIHNIQVLTELSADTNQMASGINVVNLAVQAPVSTVWPEMLNVADLF
jgi:hypothetical protein